MATDYSLETKAAVMAALLTGQSISSVAKEYKIPKGTVSGWKRKADANSDVFADATQKEEIGDLILQYLQTSLESLIAQVKFFGNQTWLAKQDADQLAVLHGVQTDKAIRLLEALTAGEDGEE